MPFTETHIEYFNAIIKPAAKAAGLEAKKADDIYGTVPIIHDIWNQIWAAKAVIADVTNKNPNVNYELGLCHSLGVPTVLITQNIDDVPFDYRHRRCIVYDRNRAYWREDLEKSITLTLKRILTGEDAFEDLRWTYDTNLLRTSRRVGSFVSSDDAMPSVLRGAKLVHDSIAKAFGPHGTNVSLSSRFGNSRSLRSGVYIAASVQSADALETKGIEHMRILSQEMSAAVGDGAKMAVLIAYALLEYGQKAIKEGAVLRDLIHGMDAAVELACSSISASARPADPKSVFDVARTAAGGDELTAKIVEQALKKAGKDGVIYTEDSLDAHTSIDVREGMYFERGFLSPKFITNEEQQNAVLDGAYVLICDSKISSMKDLLPILETVVKKGAALLTISEDLEGEALATLIVNRERGTLKCVAVRAPGHADQRQLLLEDIAVLTGGTVISGFSTALANVTLKHLGMARRIEVTKESTWITGGAGDPSLIDARAKGIRRQIDQSTVDIDIERLNARLANLVGRVAAIKVGGVSQLDKEERKYRIESALHSCRTAMGEGVVPGAGLAQLRAAEELVRTHNCTPASRIVASALEQPMKLQIQNARADGLEILSKIKEAGPVGFNAETRGVEDLMAAGIVDPARTSVLAVRIAFSHAGTILQTGAWDIPEIGDAKSPGEV
jgi:chaperonin GroEL